MALCEPRVQSIKGKKKSHLGEISPKIGLLEMLERERERERERRKESFDDFSGFIGRKSLSLEFFVSARVTRRHQKEKISSKIQKRRFGENQSLQVRKSFEIS